MQFIGADGCRVCADFLRSGESPDWKKVIFESPPIYRSRIGVLNCNSLDTGLPSFGRSAPRRRLNSRSIHVEQLTYRRIFLSISNRIDAAQLLQDSKNNEGVQRDPFAPFLAGGAHGSGSHSPSGPSSRSSDTSFAYSAGGGLDLNLTESLAIRTFDVEYLHTTFPTA